MRKPARQESKLAKKGVYQDVNDRILQVQLTMEAKIYSFSFSFVEIFAFAGFVSGLSPLSRAVFILSYYYTGVN